MSPATTTPFSGPARLLAAAERLEAFERLFVFVRAGRAAADKAAEAPTIGVRGLAGSAGAWLVAALHARAGGTLLFVAEDGEKAEEAREDLEYFLGPDAVLPFPEPETLPYDSASPHPAGLSNFHAPPSARDSANSFFLFGSSSFTEVTSSPGKRVSDGKMADVR